MIKRYFKRLKTEFKGYNAGKFGKDVLAGITVAAVALPLALAFGISSGATAAAGLITALIAGVVIGLLSGASYQISGPTGAMAAILCSLVATYQIQGVFIACFMSGVILLLCGIFKLGGLVQFIPTPVITGFTSGIAIIIAFGQINNLTGLKCEGASTIDKIVSYFNLPQTLNFEAIAIGVCVIVFMLIYPKKLNAIIPSSLMSIIIATALNFIFNFNVGIVGEIPQTLLLNDRLDITAIDFDTVKNLIFPAISIAALGLIESLLCGASAGRMKNEKLDSDQELVAQGIGNMLIPFFGGVPATAANSKNERCHKERRTDKNCRCNTFTGAFSVNVPARRRNVKDTYGGACRCTYRNCVENERVCGNKGHFWQKDKDRNVPVSYHNGGNGYIRPHCRNYNRYTFLGHHVRA